MRKKLEYPPWAIDILGQVWYLIVSIPDLCTLTYYDMNDFHILMQSCLKQLSFASIN